MPPLLLLLAWCFQPDPPEIRIRSGPYKPVASLAVQTYSVELGVTVKNRQGHPVPGLPSSDFEILDNGKPQTISFFLEQKSSATSAQPRSIVLFFDDAHTENFTLQKSRDAAKKFLSAGLLPTDRVAIFTTTGTPSVDFTTDQAPLLAALDQLKTHPDPGARGLTTCPTLTPYQAYAVEQRLDIELIRQKVQEAVRCNCGPEPAPTCIQAQEGAVQDAATSVWSIYKPQSASAIDRLTEVIRHLSTAPGQRLLLLLSPGFVTGGLDQKTSAFFDAALRSRIVVNSLNSTGLTSNRSQGMQQLILGELMSNSSISTGGQYIQNNNDLATALHTLTDPPPDSYFLAFTPTADPDDKYHPLKVRMKTPGLTVQSRPGYYSKKPDPQPESIQQRIDRLAASTVSIDEIPPPSTSMEISKST
jgi:VWFA-related protein